MVEYNAFTRRQECPCDGCCRFYRLKSGQTFKYSYLNVGYCCLVKLLQAK